MRDRPLHIQVLIALQKRVEARRQGHLEKVGRGVEDREYQRHVGRIAECAAHLEDLDYMLKSGLDEAEELEDRDNEQPQHRAQRRAKSP